MTHGIARTDLAELLLTCLLDPLHSGVFAGRKPPPRNGCGEVGRGARHCEGRFFPYLTTP